MLDLPHGILQTPGDALICIGGVAQANHRALDEIAGGGQRLAQFMGNGHGHFTHGVVARQVFELLLADPPRFFGLYLLGDVAKQQ
ncbi:hypothetical protein D3C76_1600970 [compost metagenome]